MSRKDPYPKKDWIQEQIRMYLTELEGAVSQVVDTLVKKCAHLENSRIEIIQDYDNVEVWLTGFRARTEAEKKKYRQEMQKSRAEKQRREEAAREEEIEELKRLQQKYPHLCKGQIV